MPLFGISFPWETAEGEGFIAPWTPTVMTPEGLRESGRELNAEEANFMDYQASQAAPAPAPYVAPYVAPAPVYIPPAYTPPPTKGYDLPEYMPEPGPLPAPYVAPPPVMLGPAPTAPVGVGIGAGALPGVVPVGTAVYAGAQPTHGDVVPGLLGSIVNGVPISGPGVPEPPQQMIAKHWHVKFESQKYGTFQMFYWRLIDGRCMSYHSPTKTWKIWRPRKHLVISRDPRVSNLRALGRLNKRVEKMLKPFQTKVRTLPAKALARTYLSPAERKLLT